MKRVTNYILSIGAILMLFAHSASAQSTAFTYQGSLNQGGTQAVGYFDFEFRLFDDIIDGDQLGSTLTLNAILVNNGVFSVTLDFGDQFPGAARFLEISVRQTGEAGFTQLSPRKIITNVPYAVRSMVAENAENAANAENATHAATAETAEDSANLNGQPAEFYQSASNLATGTLADARLSANVAMLNVPQTFTAVKTYSSRPRFTVTVGPPFEVTNTAKVNNLNADLIDGLDSTAFLQSVPSPLVLSSDEPEPTISATNSYSVGNVGSIAVEGVVTGLSGTTIGVRGVTSGFNGRGVFGHATNSAGLNSGVYGISDSVSGRGVSGYANNDQGSGIGVLASSNSINGFGVWARAFSSEGNSTGVYGRVESPNGRGINGINSSSTGDAVGVLGESISNSGRAVQGVVYSNTGVTSGVYGLSESTSGRGVFGLADALTGSTFGGRFESNSTSGIGVFGLADAATGTTYGGRFESSSSSGRGLLGHATSATGTTYGTYGRTDSNSGRGIYGFASSSTGTTSGVYGLSSSTSGRGVFGIAEAGTGNTFGGRFESSSTSGTGVLGLASSSSGNNVGVYGQTNSTTGIAVQGNANASTGISHGGWFTASSTSGRGIYSVAGANSGTTYGVAGQSNSSSGWGVYSFGNSGASGTKSFRIDHPDDPSNKYLLHYSAESPEVLNIYSGSVTFDENGEAVVRLPSYFTKINKDPRYLLTAVGAPMPMLHVAEEISSEALEAGAAAQPGQSTPAATFKIAGGMPGARASWEVKAVRNDQWTRQNATPVETLKQDAERGTYQHPELYGQPKEKSVNHVAEREPIEPETANDPEKPNRP